MHTNLNLSLRASLTAGYLVGLLTSYAGNYRVVFKSKNSHHFALSAYILLAAINYFLNITVIPLLVGLGINYLNAKVGLVAVLFIMNFFVSKNFIFTNKI